MKNHVKNMNFHLINNIFILLGNFKYKLENFENFVFSVEVIS